MRDNINDKLSADSTEAEQDAAIDAQLEADLDELVKPIEGKTFG